MQSSSQGEQWTVTAKLPSYVRTGKSVRARAHISTMCLCKSAVTQTPTCVRGEFDETFTWFTCSFAVHAVVSVVRFGPIVSWAERISSHSLNICASNAVEGLRYGFKRLVATYDCNIDSSIFVEVFACDDILFGLKLELLVLATGCCTDGLVCYQTQNIQNKKKNCGEKH